MKPSQMPDFSRGLRGCESLLQPLKSPVTWTDSALGAHTENTVPGVPSTTIGCAPIFCCNRVWVPSLKRYRSSSDSREDKVGVPLGEESVGGLFTACLLYSCGARVRKSFTNCSLPTTSGRERIASRGCGMRHRQFGCSL